MRIPAKVTYALLLSTLLVSCCLNTGSIEPVEENEQIPLEDLVIYEATEGREDDSTAIGIAVVGLVVVAAVPLPIAAGIMYVWASSLASDAPEEGTRNTYSASDADSAITAGDDDTLMRLDWDYAEENLNWAFVEFTIISPDGTPWDCTIDASEYCTIQQYGYDDSIWEYDEPIIISENGWNIAGDAAGETVELELRIKYRGNQITGTTWVNVA